jgi:hypothetical protein
VSAAVDLDAIEHRLAAGIAQTPWRVVNNRGFDVAMTSESGFDRVRYVAGGACLPDAELIAHAPTDLAACVARIRELEAALRPLVATDPLEYVPGAASCRYCRATERTEVVLDPDNDGLGEAAWITMPRAPVQHRADCAWDVARKHVAASGGSK